MKRGEGMLLAAGAVSAVSLMLATASVVIAILSAARPPVSQYLGAVQNDQLARAASNAWIFPTIVLAFSIGAMVQLVLRRLQLTTNTSIQRWQVSNGRIATICAITVIVGFFTVASIRSGVQAIGASGGSAGADGFALYGSVSAISSASLVCTMLSNTLFLRWRQDRQSESPEPGAAG